MTRRGCCILGGFVADLNLQCFCLVWVCRTCIGSSRCCSRCRPGSKIWPQWPRRMPIKLTVKRWKFTPVPADWWCPISTCRWCWARPRPSTTAPSTSPTPPATSSPVMHYSDAFPSPPPSQNIPNSFSQRKKNILSKWESTGCRVEKKLGTAVASSLICNLCINVRNTKGNLSNAQIDLVWN